VGTRVDALVKNRVTKKSAMILFGFINLMLMFKFSSEEFDHWLRLNLAACLTMHRRESPHKLPAKLLNSFLSLGQDLCTVRVCACVRPFTRGAKYSLAQFSVNFYLNFFSLPVALAALGLREGAQYSRQSGLSTHCHERAQACGTETIAGAATSLIGRNPKDFKPLVPA